MHLTYCLQPSLLEPFPSRRPENDPNSHIFIDSQRITPAGVDGLKGSCLNLSRICPFSGIKKVCNYSKKSVIKYDFLNK